MANENAVTKFDVAGNEVKLSAQNVRNMLVRSKTPELVSDSDIYQFIALCKFQKLNPFLNEAYLTKYKDYPAQIVISKEAYFKRADEAPSYDGIEAGVIVMRGEEVLELEGAFFLDTDILVGGWAKVYRTDRRRPVTARVKLSEYDTGQSLWLAKKSTMIAKVAKVQALREAFPTQLGAMYTHEEVTIETTYEDVTNKVEREKLEQANTQPIDLPKAEQAKPEPEPKAETKPKPEQKAMNLGEENEHPAF